MVLKTERNVADVMDGHDGDENRCCLCMDHIECWAIGKCKHPVCYICSSRMRVLGKDTQCAICKQEMEIVIFHDSPFDFDAINLKSLKCIKEYGIYFFNDDSLSLYEDLRCEKSPITDFKCNDFQELKRHMSKKHNLFACDLCVDHYLLFPRERKWYSRQALATHKRKGDVDDKSHKGHPQCQFCDKRYLDDHELYKHLRRDHHLCHICEADEGSREFIDTVQELVKHFQKKHFLCEHRDCRDDPLTSVFRSELDLKIHVADKHGGIDRKELRIEAGVSHRDHRKAQQEIQDEIEEIHNQPLPNVQDKESFPSLGGKKGTPMQLGSKKPTSQQSYRSLSSKNINSTEDFPTLGGGMGAPMARPGTNWNNKAKQNNKPVTRPAGSSKKKKTLISPSPSSYVPSNPASAHVPTHDGPSNWSAEPDRFVERSQLEIRAEQEALARQNSASKKVSIQKSDFPTLGGAPKTQAFWGVPGSSIPKSSNKKKASKVVSAGKPKPEFTNKKSKVDNSKSISLITSSIASASISTNQNGASKQSTKKQQQSVQPVVFSNPPSGSNASDIATRMTGGYAGWSAPPEVFHEKSLLQIEEEKRAAKNKHKKQAAPKQTDFPNLGGSKSPTPQAFWGVPGSAFPKSNSKKNKTPPSKPIKKPVQKKEVTVQPISFDSPAARPQKKEKTVLQSPLNGLNESQNASILASRMTGGSSGWSAPPEVFQEKSLLQIEEEKRQKSQNSKKKNKNAPKMDDMSFPTLGGGMSNEQRVNMAFEYRATTTYSEKFSQPENKTHMGNGDSAAEKLRKAKKLEAEKLKKQKEEDELRKNATKSPKEVKPEENFPKIEDEESDDEFLSANEEEPESDSDNDVISDSEKEDNNRRAINERLMSAINNMNPDDQTNFKIASGKFRTGQLNADEYIEMGCLLMGKKSFRKILPDLLQTLPAGKHKDALTKAQIRMN